MRNQNLPQTESCKTITTTKHSVVRSSEVAAKPETTTDEQEFHEAKDATYAETMSKKTKKSRSSTPRGSLEDDKAGSG